MSDVFIQNFQFSNYKIKKKKTDLNLFVTFNANLLFSLLIDTIEIEVIAIIKGSHFTVDVVPIVADLILLVERSVIRTQEAGSLVSKTLHHRILITRQLNNAILYKQILYTLYGSICFIVYLGICCEHAETYI